jgi:hypothetical protein
MGPNWNALLFLLFLPPLTPPPCKCVCCCMRLGCLIGWARMGGISYTRCDSIQQN